MGEVDREHIVNISSMSDSELKGFMQKNGISLKIDEIKLICKLLGRSPTLTELHIFNTEWSEHCSYKSSRELLKLLPTEGPTVMQGPKEDAGIIHFTTINGEKYGIVIAHESHNHPSQVVPFEGAATGIGGIVRDVICMGAKIIATADPLRFGNPNGKFKERTKYIANAVVDGIACYSNPIGIPNLAGDLYFDQSFDDNCVINVVSLGLVKESEIIHSSVPANSEGYDVIVVGKATDNSGFGGAAFASLILDEEDKESNRGAVQVPDPFLKNVLIRATYDVFKEVRKHRIPVGFKDCGAGGIMCASSELGSEANLGMDIDLDKVHISINNLPPYITACGETQERFVWVVPPSFTPTLLKIYNEDWELPRIAEGARASVVGKVTKQPQYVLRHKGKIVCSAPIKEVTSGIKYQRQSKEPKRQFAEPQLGGFGNYNSALLDVLKHPNVCSRSKIFEHYDTEVQGNAVIRPGEADAGVMSPIRGIKAGIALSTDCNPRYCKINPFMGAVNAVAEAMRNVAAVGAVPYGMTDCLNFGNPEEPESFWEFEQSVKGLSEAARNLYLKDTKEPVAFVSGNVSFYNESAEGSAVHPSPIIACLGIMQDYSKAITMRIKKPNTVLCLVGPRKDELGGSVYYDLFGQTGKNIPKIDYALERGMIYGVIDAISERLLLSCHDISDGGLATCVAEMALGSKGHGKIGIALELNDSMPTHKLLFSESSGFVMEIEREKIPELEKQFAKYNVELFKIGETTEQSELKINHNGKEVVNLTIKQMANAWSTGLKEALE